MRFPGKLLPGTNADRSGRASSDPGQAVFRIVSWLALGTALVMSLFVLGKGWNQPLLELHGFRQTQTALTTYWLLQGGDWLAYETPVLGAPWSVPMEFPWYQWCVALATYLTSAHLDQVGRVISYLFFLLCLIPIGALCRTIGADQRVFPVAAALLLAAPIYLFWSRTFMIESAALLLALLFVSLHLRWLYNGEISAALGAAVFAVLGILTKVTTFIPYGLLAAALSLPWMMERTRFGEVRVLVLRMSIAAATACITLLILLWWVTFSDQLKALNALGDELVSERLTSWNFGTYAQRFSAALWNETIGGRAIPEAVGSVTLFWVAVGASLWLKRRAAFFVITFAVVWVSAFLIFTNLHVVHNYYQYSNAALLVLGLGLIIAELGKYRPLVASGLLLLALFSQWHHFVGSYADAVAQDVSHGRTMKISELIRRETPEASAIIVLGYDWSSEIAYYSQRKALNLPDWAKPSRVEAILSSPGSFVGSLPISAVVYCRDRTPELQQVVAEARLASLPIERTETIADCDVLLLQTVSGQER